MHNTRQPLVYSYGWNPARDGAPGTQLSPIVNLLITPSLSLGITVSLTIEQAKFLAESLEDSIVEATTGRRPAHPTKLVSSTFSRIENKV